MKRGMTSPLREAADYFDTKTTLRFVDCTTQSDIHHFFHGKLTPAAAQRHYATFVRLCATVPGRDDEWLETVARGFARRLVSIMVTQARLEDFVTLASKTPFYGFPTPSEILYGENLDESENQETAP